MAVTNKVYTKAASGFMDGTYKWKTSGGSTFKLMLVSGYSFNQDTHDFIDDVSASEVGASGTYAAGGTALVTYDPTTDAGTNETRFNADDVEETGCTISATGAVVYQDSGTPSTSRLICYVDFGGTEASVAGTFKHTWDASGVFKVTAAS